MKAPPWFKFFPQDFLVGTAFMSPEEVGVYIRMLCYQWTHGSLPNDQEKVCRLVGCHGNAVAQVWHKFGSCEDGAIRNSKLESVRTDQEKKQHSQAVNATKRWRNVQKQSNGNATAQTSHVNGSCQTPCQNDAPQISDIRVSPIVPKGTGQPPKNPFALRINAMMGRKDSTIWADKEIKAFKRIKFEEDDMAAVEAYYLSERKKQDNICRTSIYTLLNNWACEVDRANAFLEKKADSKKNGVNGVPKSRLV